jgi:hypothetical protein
MLKKQSYCATNRVDALKTDNQLEENELVMINYRDRHTNYEQHT